MSSTAAKPEPSPVPEPLFSRLVVAPVMFVSFLVSLFVIDRQTYSEILGRRSSTDGYYHSHQRKLAKQEMDDAFQLRNKVIAAFCMCGGVVIAVFGWSMSKAWHTVMPRH